MSSPKEAGLPTSWAPCLTDPTRGIAFFDGLTIESDKIQDSRSYRVLPLLEEEQVLMCRLMKRRLKEGLRVLDVGTGSGVFALWAAKHGCAVVAIDMSPRATAMARHNARRNDGIELCPAERALRPEAGEVSLITEEFSAFARSLKLEDQFDLVVLSPPYNPTLPRIRPALHADAGPLGQTVMEAQLRWLPKVLKIGGTCVGNHMVVFRRDEDGERVVDLSRLSGPFEPRGMRVAWTPMLRDDPIPVGEFLEMQYSAASTIFPRDVVGVLSRWLTRLRRCYEGAYFDLVYFEAVPTADGSVEHELLAVKNEALPRRTWSDRVFLHRRIVENFAYRDSVSAPELFMTHSIVPKCNLAEESKRELPKKWQKSFLRRLSHFLVANRMLSRQPQAGTHSRATTLGFELILVDFAPFYEEFGGVGNLRQECGAWSAGPNDLLRLLDGYQRNTLRQHRANEGPFLHPAFMMRAFKDGEKHFDHPVWPPVQMTISTGELRNRVCPRREGCRSADRESSSEQNHDADAWTTIDTLEYLREDLLETDDLPAASAYSHSTLEGLAVVGPAELSGYNEGLRARLASPESELGTLGIQLSATEELVKDLEYLHNRMHQNLDQFVAANTADSSRLEGAGSFLLGIPLHSPSTTGSGRLRWEYRGAAWIYALATEPFESSKEQRLLDVARFLQSELGAYFTQAAFKATMSAERSRVKHETSAKLAALRDWPRPAGDLKRAVDADPASFRTIPFFDEYARLVEEIESWANDDLAHPIESELPLDWDGFFSYLWNEAVATRIALWLSRCTVGLSKPEHYDRVAQAKELIRVCFEPMRPVLRVHPPELRPGDLSEGRRRNVTRLLLIYYREAIQHGDWSVPIEGELSLKNNLFKLALSNSKGKRSEKEGVIDAALEKQLSGRDPSLQRIRSVAKSRLLGPPPPDDSSSEAAWDRSGSSHLPRGHRSVRGDRSVQGEGHGSKILRDLAEKELDGRIWIDRDAYRLTAEFHPLGAAGGS